MDIIKLLEDISNLENISDVHLTAESYPVVRLNGDLKKYRAEYLQELEQSDLEAVAREMMTEEQHREFKDMGELDFSYSIPDIGRYRVNAYHQRSSVCIALRIIPNEVPSIESLNLPEVIRKLAYRRMGLLLSTGPTGSGKTTTQAAIINEINRNKSVHVLTLEDPIEYLHKHEKSYVHQREIGSDTTSFSRGLRACLRQDPDVILVGEMRDLDTISTALEAAETGHMVLATLHTNSAPLTVDRIVDIFPGEQQQQVRIQLASVLNGVIAQRLLPKKDGTGRVAALEVMLGTPAVRNIIREGKSSQLYSTMQAGGKQGMVVMDSYIIDLYKKGDITRATAISWSVDKEEVQKKLSM